MAADPVLCLDSGTTTVKAAVYDRAGAALARVEQPNTALERSGERVEQDMARSFEDAARAIAAARAQVTGPIGALALTAQGDGLWPLDAAGAPAGKALTWLDGRAAGLSAAMPEALDAVEAITSARPTAASQTLQLLWLQCNDPARFAAIRHALRLKEWLFYCLTGRLVAEAGGALPAWGDWAEGRPSPAVPEALGLECGVALLPEFASVADCVAPLSAQAAARTGLPAGLPVVLGPGDVQSSLVGLGVGPGLGLSRASIFGTSAIHGRYYPQAEAIPPKLSGAMVQRFATGQGFVCFHPCFNGGTVFRHVEQVLGGAWPAGQRPAYSGLVLHPFFEPGGERAPITDPLAQAAVLGLGAQTTPAELGWAAREALAFLTRISHAGLGEGGDGPAVAVGGGVARDATFMQLLASVLGRPVRPHAGGDTALRGLGAIALGVLDPGTQGPVPDAGLLAPNDAGIAPEGGAVGDYLARKFELFERLLADMAGHWAALAALREEARGLV